MTTNTLKIRENALDTFWKDQQKFKKLDFYAPIKKLNLKSFKPLGVKKTIKLKDKAVNIAARRTIFVRFLALAQSQGPSLLSKYFATH